MEGFNDRRSGGFNRGGGGFRNNNRFSGPVTKHKATCSDCKQECEVPFEPKEGRPVYCNDCFKNHRKF